jgi:hypothetical protein
MLTGYISNISFLQSLQMLCSLPTSKDFRAIMGEEIGIITRKRCSPPEALQLLSDWVTEFNHNDAFLCSEPGQLLVSIPWADDRDKV